MTSINHTRGIYERRGNFDPVPAGFYKVYITKAEIVRAKSGLGNVLKLTYTIPEGLHIGRRIFDNINIEHENKEAESIGKNCLNGILHAIDLRDLGNTDQLLDKPLCVEVGIQTYNQKDKNTILAYDAASEYEKLIKQKPISSNSQNPKPTGTKAADDVFDDVPF